MNDNDNRRPRRRAARSAGPPVEETAAETVTISKSETASPSAALDAEATAKIAGNSAAGTAVKPADVTVQLAASEPAETGGAAAPRARGGILALAAAILLVLALVAGAGYAAFTAYSVNRDEDLRAQYTETARQAVLNLTTIRAQTAKEDIDRILAVASGDFKTEFDGRVDPFMDVVKQANVVSSGEVVESGIVTADADSAQVLVAAKQTVSNNGSPEPQSRQYRFRVTVSNSDTGMTVSKVEFVG
ncbi:hypothetical protein [Nocardia canadensis]|uniref:hypothetical protein n=1 Tax=Nocardia canadensis TaxID=3065238 RepID=UPI00292FBADD|nr:hypothetical protein [Nocardia canadensis]